jgi:hypothetical protein
MKRLIALILLASTVAACTPEQEAKWQATVSAIKQGVKVTTEAARQTLDEVCGQQAFINQGAQVALSIAVSRGNGPRTQRAVRDTNTSMAALAAACGSGNASTNSLASLAVKAWAAYQAVKAAQAAAQTANGA